MASFFNPITRKRLQRFRTMRRAWWSFWILLGLYTLSLFANVLSNNLPLLVRYEGRNYYPILRFHPESTFTGSDRHTRPNYKALKESPAFADQPGNFILFPIISHSPHEIIQPDAIDIPELVDLTLEREPLVGALEVTPDGRIRQSVHAAGFFPSPQDRDLRGRELSELVALPAELQAAIDRRLRNQPADAVAVPLPLPDFPRPVTAHLAVFQPATTPPDFVRIILREQRAAGESTAPVTLTFDRQLEPHGATPAVWNALTPAERDVLRQDVDRHFEVPVEPYLIDTAQGQYRARFDREVVTYPFRPTRNHPFGIDSSGRDVLANILYALRTSMSFGLLLVAVIMLIGIVIGALQGYFGGIVDMTAQRLSEVWAALPFLYIIILLGSIYGRSFTLLLFCYGIFNWIGISYYIRAEFLRLRKQPFVEAARVTGLRRRRIIFKHIMPNALVPVITFFPFSLVGAIGSLAALDYLGFGLPAGTPSWGGLLAQAQEFRFAWWLTLYPSLALFIVILLGVFIGEGVRSAFDPRAESKME